MLILVDCWERWNEHNESNLICRNKQVPQQKGKNSLVYSFMVDKDEIKHLYRHMSSDYVSNSQKPNRFCLNVCIKALEH